MSTETPVAAWAPASRLLITLAAAALLIWGLYGGREIIGPLALAMVLVVIVHPVRYGLEKKGWPRWAATASVVAMVYLILAVLLVLLILALAQFASLLPDYADEFVALTEDVQALLLSWGVSSETASSTVDAINPSTIFGLIFDALSSLASGAVAFFLVVAYVIFMAADAAYTRPLFERFEPTHHHLLSALSGYSTGVRRYIVVNTIFGAIVAVLDGVALLWIGIPGAFVWAVLAFITNFIPNIGFIIGLVPPLVLALLIGGWGPALAVLIVYIVVNVTLQVLVQPRFISDAVGLSFTITFVAVIFWSAVLGALGALLAVPMTLLVKALLVDSDPKAVFAQAVTGGSEARAPVEPVPTVPTGATQEEPDPAADPAPPTSTPEEPH